MGRSMKMGNSRSSQLHSNFESFLGYVTCQRHQVTPEGAFFSWGFMAYSGTFDGVVLIIQERFLHSVSWIAPQSNPRPPFLIECVHRNWLSRWSFLCWRISLIQRPWQPQPPGPFEFSFSALCSCLPLSPWSGSFWPCRALRFGDVLISSTAVIC